MAILRVGTQGRRAGQGGVHRLVPQVKDIVQDVLLEDLTVTETNHGRPERLLEDNNTCFGMPVGGMM